MELILQVEKFGDDVYGSEYFNIGAKVGGRQVGVLNFSTNVNWYMPAYGNVAFIISLIVNKSERKRGIGSSLLSEAERVAEENGINYMFLRPSDDASEWYEKRGYKPIINGLLAKGLK